VKPISYLIKSLLVYSGADNFVKLVWTWVSSTVR